MRSVSALVCVALFGACSQSEGSATEAEVIVGGDASLMGRLRRVRTSVHALDTLAAWRPLQQREFLLAKQAPAAPNEVLAPFSFGVARSTADRFELVVEGFDSTDPQAEPVIERKLLATFEPNRRIRVVVQLREACHALSRPCTSLLETCHPEARACGPVPQASDEAETDAGILTDPVSSTPSAACPADNPCSADYPCVTTEPSGYTCLGQHADWPMPIAGSDVPLAYDVQTDPRIVTDRVTGLVWQREMPAIYPGCSGSRRSPGDSCTWDEAKLYCQELALAERKWRLPTKIELESLIDTSLGAPTILEPDFTPLRWGTFWTASSNPFAETAEGKRTQMWNVSFLDGASGFAVPSEPSAVRCVSGIPRGEGVPTDRYRLDAVSNTVTDSRTGRTWQRTTSGPLATLDEAQKYCAALGGGFRVPMVKEAMTLVDPTRSGPALDPVFPRRPQSFSWATAPRGDGGLDTWVTELTFGASYTMDRFEFGRARIDISKVPDPFVRCVR